MSQIDRISERIAKRISSELDLDNDKTEVLAYGAFALLHTLLSIILVVIFGAMFHVMVEALIISFVISILRKYSGGVHASNSSSCAIIGTVVSVALALLLSGIGLKIKLISVVAITVIVFIYSYYTVIRLAPVDSPSKPIRKEEKKIRMKKGSIFVLHIYASIIAIFVILFCMLRRQNLLIYILSISFGILWQVFTLTYIGHIVVGRIDTLLNQILNLGRSEG